MTVGEVPWLIEGRNLIGIKEIKGPQNNAEILRLRADAGTGIANDDEAWCSDFVGGCMKRALVRPTHSPSARSWLHWGVDCTEARRDLMPLGCVGVFDRPPNPWQGHVGFLVGYTEAGDFMVLGGNQSDSVSIARVPGSRFLNARWPIEFRGDVRFARMLLPLMKAPTAVSHNEA